MFKIIGNPNGKVRITFLQNEVLKEQNEGMGEVAAQYFVSEAFEDTQFQSTLLQVGEANVVLSDQGMLFLWLGANLDLSQATPDYTCRNLSSNWNTSDGDRKNISKKVWGLAHCPWGIVFLRDGLCPTNQLQHLDRE